MKIKKLYEEDKTSAFYDYVIQPSDRSNNLVDDINLILDFIEKQFSQIWFEKRSTKNTKQKIN